MAKGNWNPSVIKPKTRCRRCGAVIKNRVYMVFLDGVTPAHYHCAMKVWPEREFTLFFEKQEMTPEEFTKDPARREALARALADPALVEAIALVEEMMEPKTGTQADAAPAMAASYFHQVAGANHFRRKLKELTREPSEKKTPKLRTLAKTEADLPKD